MSEPPGPPEPDPSRPDDAYPAYYPPGEAPVTPWEPRRDAAPEHAPGPSRGALAFGLALLPFLVTNLVSLGLAVVVLARARRAPSADASPGTGFAVLAVVIDVLVVTAWVLLVLALIR